MILQAKHLRCCPIISTHRLIMLMLIGGLKQTHCIWGPSHAVGEPSAVLGSPRERAAS